MYVNVTDKGNYETILGKKVVAWVKYVDLQKCNMASSVAVVGTVTLDHPIKIGGFNISSINGNTTTYFTTNVPLILGWNSPLLKYAI